MTSLACTAVLQQLQAYHDDELRVADQIAVGTHVDGCATCREALTELQALMAETGLTAAMALQGRRVHRVRALPVLTGRPHAGVHLRTRPEQLRWLDAGRPAGAHRCRHRRAHRDRRVSRPATDRRPPLVTQRGPGLRRQRQPPSRRDLPDGRHQGSAAAVRRATTRPVRRPARVIMT